MSHNPEITAGYVYFHRFMLELVEEDPEGRKGRISRAVFGNNFDIITRRERLCWKTGTEVGY